MFVTGRTNFNLVVRTLIVAVVLFCYGAPAEAQETGGALVGGAGIFRPKNPEAKRTMGTTRPRPRPNTNTAPNPAEIEEKFQDGISKGNDARNARNYSPAETFYRSALKLKPRNTSGFQGLGNVFVDQQRWDDAEEAYRKAVEYSPIIRKL